MWLLTAPAQDVSVEPSLNEYSVGDVINCSANGWPAPSVAWRHVGGPMVVGVSDGSMLNVVEAMRDGPNVWKCIAMNNFGSAELVISFNVSRELTTSLLDTSLLDNLSLLRTRLWRWAVPDLFVDSGTTLIYLIAYLTSFITFFLPYLLPYSSKLFVCLLNFLASFFLTYWLPYLCTSSRIRSFHFQAWGHRRRLALSCFCSLYVVVYCVMDACLLLLYLFQFFSTEPRDWLGRPS